MRDQTVHGEIVRDGSELTAHRGLINYYYTCHELQTKTSRTVPVAKPYQKFRSSAQKQKYTLTSCLQATRACISV